MNRITAVAISIGLLLALVAAVAPATAAAEGRYTSSEPQSGMFVSVGGLGGLWRTGVLSSPSLDRFETDSNWYLNLQIGTQGATGMHYIFDIGYGRANNDDRMLRFMPAGVRFEYAMPSTPSNEEGFSFFAGLQGGVMSVRDDGTKDKLGYLAASLSAGISWYTGSFVFFGEAIFAYGESVFGEINGKWEGRGFMNDEVSYYREYGVRIGVGVRF